MVRPLDNGDTFNSEENVTSEEIQDARGTNCRAGLIDDDLADPMFGPDEMDGCKDSEGIDIDHVEEIVEFPYNPKMDDPLDLGNTISLCVPKPNISSKVDYFDSFPRSNLRDNKRKKQIKDVGCSSGVSDSLEEPLNAYITTDKRPSSVLGDHIMTNHINDVETRKTDVSKADVVIETRPHRTTAKPVNYKSQLEGL